MSKTVFRYDRRGHGALRSPVMTPQGFMRIDGHAARVGIYEYPRKDGSIQYELRPRDEVFHADSLASYDAAPVTLEHPADEEVTSENVRRHEVGTVSGPAREDGDSVAVSLVVKDAKAIKAIRAGKQELSPGYKIRLDETPGFAPEFATPSNPTGRYHAVQRDVRVNHQALVDRARGGSTMRLRMDAAEGWLCDERADAGGSGGGGNPNHDDHGRFAAGGGTSVRPVGSHAALGAVAAAHAAAAKANRSGSSGDHARAQELFSHASAMHGREGNEGTAAGLESQARHHALEGISARAHEASRAASTPEDHTAAHYLHQAAADSHDASGRSGTAAEHRSMENYHHRMSSRRTDGMPLENTDQLAAAMSRFPHERWADTVQEKTAYHRILARAAALRVDASDFRSSHSARLDSGGKLTTVADGHQHLVDPCGWDGQQRSSGETSYALAEGANVSHGHPWTMGMDGTITIGEAAGHLHAVIDAASAPAPAGYLAPTAYSTT